MKTENWMDPTDWTQRKCLSKVQSAPKHHQIKEKKVCIKKRWGGNGVGGRDHIKAKIQGNAQIKDGGSRSCQLFLYVDWDSALRSQPCFSPPWIKGNCIWQAISFLRPSEMAPKQQSLGSGKVAQLPCFLRKVSQIVVGDKKWLSILFKVQNSLRIWVHKNLIWF